MQRGGGLGAVESSHIKSSYEESYVIIYIYLKILTKYFHFFTTAFKIFGAKQGKTDKFFYEIIFRILRILPIFSGHELCQNGI